MRLCGIPLSRDFAARCAQPLVPLGEFALPGILAQPHVHGVADDAGGAVPKSDLRTTTYGVHR
jgi:hypothetical protein